MSINRSVMQYSTMDEKHLDSIEKISDEIEAFRKESAERGLVFYSLTPEQVLEKLRSSTTPFIDSISYTSRSSAGIPFIFQIDVRNPDSTYHDGVFAYLFFGPATMIPDPSTALLSVDERLYRGYAKFPIICPNATSRVVFNYTFPIEIPLGFYIGNVFIFGWLVPLSPIYDRSSGHIEIF